MFHVVAEIFFHVWLELSSLVEAPQVQVVGVMHLVVAVLHQNLIVAVFSLVVVGLSLVYIS